MNLLFSSTIFSQSVNWVKIKYSSGSDLEVLSDSTIIACTFGEGFIFSSNDGSSWIERNPPSVNHVEKLTINTATNSIFTSSRDNKKIYRSTNEGVNWELSLNHTGQIQDMTSRNGVIYSIDYLGKFYQSNDDGFTWDSSTVAYGLLSIAVCSTDQIFIGTFGDKIYTSVDSGATWTKLNHDVIGYHVEDIAINSSDVVFATKDYSIIVSSDYGASWFEQSAPASLGLESTLIVDTNDNLIGGSNSIIKSTNWGLNWTSLGGGFYGMEAIEVFKEKVYLANSSGIYRYDPAIPTYVGNNYFPLNSGNIWQFITHTIGIDIHSYSLVEYSVVEDTLINDEKYYKYSSRNENKWMRYSEHDKKAWFWWNESDRLFMDYNLPPMASFQQYTFGGPRQANVVGGTSTMFGTSIKHKGYVVGGTFSGGEHREYFGEDVGPIFYRYQELDGPDFTHYNDLIMAIIYDSTDAPIYWTNQYKPEIILSPVQLINNKTFRLEFEVDHHYSQFYDPSFPHHGINFVDSVYMISNYTKNDSTIENSIIKAMNISETNDYVVTALLDTNLLKDNFVFNYKIVAKDRGIIPESSASPYSGYYNCVWGEPTIIVDNNNNYFSFNLNQNYPNPFNPITTIEYSLPKSNFVTLKVFDLLGREITSLVNEEKLPGNYSVKFDASQFSSGIYFYRLKAGSFIDTKKFILMK